MTIERAEFDGHIAVSISENEVRVWVCDSNGQNIFRFKALGRVYKGQQDITVIENKPPVSYLLINPEYTWMDLCVNASSAVCVKCREPECDWAGTLPRKVKICPELAEPCKAPNCQMIKEGVCQLNPFIYPGSEEKVTSK